jgi:hypothetical protein
MIEKTENKYAPVTLSQQEVRHETGGTTKRHIQPDTKILLDKKNVIK